MPPKAHCAICGYVAYTVQLYGMHRAAELFDQGIIRSNEKQPWVFCRSCRDWFENYRDQRP